MGVVQSKVIPGGAAWGSRRCFQSKRQELECSEDLRRLFTEYPVGREREGNMKLGAEESCSTGWRARGTAQCSAGFVRAAEAARRKDGGAAASFLRA